jgi:RNA polymerase sigma-70 factor (ECF subfamily)
MALPAALFWRLLGSSRAVQSLASRERISPPGRGTSLTCTGLADDLASLLRATSAGDADAFAALYDATCTEAFAVAYARTRCPKAAEVAILRSYLAVWESSLQFQTSWMSTRAQILATVYQTATGSRPVER